MKRIYERPYIEVEEITVDIITSSTDGEWDEFGLSSELGL